ncbi:hypothetical protein IAR55_006019 [Kwoniella newhampshirensis]|uniref:Zn(2)-C6 fungal-type domain-containing protein n=1 Tax=Kwoniella newhampshirensis TaxID=1651941 RepID=A0AAW0YI93_9TREE
MAHQYYPYPSPAHGPGPIPTVVNSPQMQLQHRSSYPQPLPSSLPPLPHQSMVAPIPSFQGPGSIVSNPGSGQAQSQWTSYYHPGGWIESLPPPPVETAPNMPASTYTPSVDHSRHHSRAPSPVIWGKDHPLEEHQQNLRQQFQQYSVDGKHDQSRVDALAWECNAVGGGKCYATSQEQQRQQQQRQREQQSNGYGGQYQNQQQYGADKKEEEVSLFDTFAGSVVNLETGSRFDQLLEAKMNLMNQNRGQFEPVSVTAPPSQVDFSPLGFFPSTALPVEQSPLYPQPPSSELLQPSLSVSNSFTPMSQTQSPALESQQQEQPTGFSYRVPLSSSQSPSWQNVPNQYSAQPPMTHSPSNVVYTPQYGQQKHQQHTPTPPQQRSTPPMPLSLDPAAVERRLQDLTQTQIQPDLVAPLPNEISWVLQRHRSSGSSDSDRRSSYGQMPVQSSSQDHSKSAATSGMTFKTPQSGYSSTPLISSGLSQTSTSISLQPSQTLPTSSSLPMSSGLSTSAYISEPMYATHAVRRSAQSSPLSDQHQPPKPTFLSRKATYPPLSDNSPALGFSGPPPLSESQSYPSAFPSRPLQMPTTELPWINPLGSTNRIESVRQPPPLPEALPPVLKIRVFNSEQAKRNPLALGSSVQLPTPASAIDDPSSAEPTKSSATSVRPTNSKKFSFSTTMVQPKKARGKGKAKKNLEESSSGTKEPQPPSASKSPESKKRKNETAETNEERERRLLDKTTIACNMCRTKKLKCNGDRPRCFHCARRGEEACTYDPVLRRRGKGRKNKKKGSAGSDRSGSNAGRGDSSPSEESGEDELDERQDRTGCGGRRDLGIRASAKGEEAVIGDMSYLLKKDTAQSGGMGMGMGFGGGLGMGSGSRFELSTERG